MRSKKIFIFIIAVLMIAVSSVFTPYPAINASALSTSQLKNKISDYEAKAKAIQKEINGLQGDKNKYKELKNSLDKQVRNTQDQIDLVNNQIYELNRQIKDNEAKIKQKEAEMNETKDTLKKRLKAIYIAGNNSKLQVILSAKDFGDFLSRTELMRGVTEHDTKLLDKLNKDIKDINDKKAEIEKKKGETDELKATLVTKQKSLDSQYASAKNMLNSITSKESSLEDDIDEIEEKKKAVQRQWEAAIAAERDSGRVYNGDGFAWPFQSSYYISSSYGWRSRGYHTGIDITCGGAYGKPIYAAADGKVILRTISNVSYGNHLIIDHGMKDGNQYSTLYAHCSSLLVSSGETVKKGQLIAYVGSTGNSTGPHLHYEIRVNGQHTNPMNYYRNF